MNRLITFLSLTILCSCATDQLDGEYNDFEGRWYWYETAIVAEPPIDSSSREVITPQETGYTAQIELTSEGRILFYRDGFVISDNRFKLEEKSDETGRKRIVIEVKGETTGDISIEGSQLQFFLFGDTLLGYGYPFQGLDDVMDYIEADNATIEGNYFLR